MPLSTHDTRPCGRCGADIFWAVTNGQKPMPVDPHPHPEGNVALWRDLTGRLRARVISKERPINEYSEQRHMPHFATCGRATT